MLDFLKSILTFIATIGQVIANAIQGLLSVFLLIPQGLQFITTTIGFIPSALAVFAITGIAICVVFFVIDR